MSWSFRRRLPAMRRSEIVFSQLLCAAAVMSAAPVLAAQYYVQPTATVSAETDSNLDLDPGSHKSVEGYIADAAAVIGVLTPSSSTTIRPRVDYRNYPADSADDRLEEYLDLNSAYRSQRSKGSVYLGFERRDEFNAELSSALYDPNVPVSPTSPETGRAIKGAVRTSVILLPDYSYSVTERTSAGVSGVFQHLGYSPNNAFDAVDFDYYQAKAYLRWNLTQRNDLTVGGTGSEYKATRFDSRATSGGAAVTLDTSWTPLLSTSATAVYQRTTIDTSIPSPFKAKVNPWGATFSAIYKAEANQFRMDGGRVVTPSGGGGIYINDQVQLQYLRNVTQRLTLTAAVVALKNSGLTSNVNGNARTFVRTVVEGKWMFTPTFFVQGGYQYMHQKYEVETGSAANNRIYIRFGYQGRNPQW
jgi:hypothetical protein